jgi:hypothetical protein
MSFPVQKLLLVEDIVATGTDTITFKSRLLEHPFASVYVAVYLPALAEEIVGIDGFLVLALNPFGPVQIQPVDTFGHGPVNIFSPSHAVKVLDCDQVLVSVLVL